MKMDLVLIEFEDAHSLDGWRTIDTLIDSNELNECHAVGWIIEKSKSCLTIISQTSGNRQTKILHQGAGGITISRKAIIKTTILKKAKTS